MRVCVNDYRGKGARNFILYAIARIQQETEHIAYRVYVTDMLKSIIDIELAKCEVNNDIPRYYDIVHQKKVVAKSGGEIVSEFLSRHNMEVKP